MIPVSKQNGTAARDLQNPPSKFLIPPHQYTIARQLMEAPWLFTYLSVIIYLRAGVIRRVYMQLQSIDIVMPITINNKACQYFFCNWHYELGIVTRGRKKIGKESMIWNQNNRGTGFKCHNQLGRTKERENRIRTITMNTLKVEFGFSLVHSFKICLSLCIHV